MVLLSVWARNIYQCIVRKEAELFIVQKVPSLEFHLIENTGYEGGATYYTGSKV
jgi:hypothetical protein